ncbi:MAG TPA: tRNA (adenosine(37)-N6)-dimethylallyltransferase MiaA [Candidatus Obscuribacterales bacterium]
MTGELTGKEHKDRQSGKPLVVAVVGPTCSGKTALSLKIAALRKAEIVACDSRTIYRHMDIGTAKPTAAQRAAVPHHMIDVVDPDQGFTVAQYKDKAEAAIAQILERGALPLVVGGTGFYARALLEGLEIPAVEPQPELRSELRRFAEERGSQALHARLAAADPASAARIGVNDVFRVVRALEVSTVLGKPFSELVRRRPPPYNTLWIGLTARNRQVLHQAIKERFINQMQEGMLAEVEGLLDRYGRTHAIMNTVNYRELALYLEGSMDRETAEAECVKHNRQLARRQLIWFRANPHINWYYFDEATPRQLQEKILSFIDTHLERP